MRTASIRMFCTVLGSIVLGLSFGFPADAKTKAGAKSKLSSYTLSVQQYRKLSSARRLQYMNALRALAVEVEAAQKINGLPLKYSEIRQKPLLDFSLIPNAYADEGTCNVGGVIRSLIGGKCPTFGRAILPACAGIEDGFMCGKIFGEICVPRNPGTGENKLTQRCADASKASDVKPEHYNEIVDVYGRLLESAYRNTHPEVQEILNQRIKEVNARFSGDSSATSTATESAGDAGTAEGGSPAQAGPGTAEGSPAAAAAPVSVAPSVPPAPVNPPSPPSAPAPPAVPQTPSTPAPVGANPLCGTLHVFNVEGSSNYNGATQEDMRLILSKKTEVYKDHATSIRHIRPSGTQELRVQKGPTEALIKRINDSNNDNICTIATDMNAFFEMRDPYTQVANAGPENRCGSASNCTISKWREPTSSDRGLSLVDQIIPQAMQRELRNAGIHCGQNRPRIVVNIAAHGSDEGFIQLERGINLKATDLGIVLDQLKTSGVDVHVDTTSCYGGSNFKDKMMGVISPPPVYRDGQARTQGRVCSVATAENASAQQGDSYLFPYTTDMVFPKALYYFKDFHKARLCAALAENLNVAVTATRSAGGTKGMDSQFLKILNNIRTSSFSAADKLECEKAVTAASSGRPTADPDKILALRNCPATSPDVKAWMEETVKSANQGAGPTTSVGLANFNSMNNPKDAANCTLDLTKYSPKAISSAAPGNSADPAE